MGHHRHALFRYGLFQQRAGLSDHGLLCLLAALVFFIQLRGHNKGLLFLRAQKQAQCAHGIAQAPGRIESGAKAKADMPGADLFAGKAAYLGQRRNCGPRGLIHLQKPLLYNGAVFIQQRHNIRHGGKGHKVYGFHRLFPAKQRTAQLKRHARAAQHMKRIIR